MSQQMRNCVCKMQTATTGTRPLLVASQYSVKGTLTRRPSSHSIIQFKHYSGDAFSDDIKLNIQCYAFVDDLHSVWIDSVMTYS